MDNGFEQAYERFMENQLAKSNGERKRRLLKGHGHVEKLFLQNVWWPAFGQFDRLQAEWEVLDLRGGYRYLDFAYMQAPLLVAIEIEGFGPHLKIASRWTFADSHLRAAYLQLEGWRVFRFAYDTVNEQPQQCQRILWQLMGKWTGLQGGNEAAAYSPGEKAIIRLAIRTQSSVTPKHVCAEAGVCDRTARRWLQSLVDKGTLRAARGKQRVRAYELCIEQAERFIGKL